MKSYSIVSLIVLILALVFSPLPANANKIRILAVHPGVLWAICGGLSNTHWWSDGPADGNGYGCTRDNCDGKGGICFIMCEGGGNCIGSTPLKATPHNVNLYWILQAGDRVNHAASDLPPSGGKSGGCGAGGGLGSGPTVTAGGETPPSGGTTQPGGNAGTPATGGLGHRPGSAADGSGSPSFL